MVLTSGLVLILIFRQLMSQLMHTTSTSYSTLLANHSVAQGEGLVLGLVHEWTSALLVHAQACRVARAGAQQH